MDPFALNPSELSVESFDVAAPDPYADADKPTGMKTYEPGCTTPDLCPNTVAAVA